MPLFKMVKNHKSNLTMKNTFDNTVKQSFKWYIQEKKEEKKSSIKKFCHSVHVFLHKKFCSFPVVQLQSSKKIKNGTPLQTPIVYNVSQFSVKLNFTIADTSDSVFSFRNYKVSFYLR